MYFIKKYILLLLVVLVLVLLLLIKFYYCFYYYYYYYYYYLKTLTVNIHKQFTRHCVKVTNFTELIQSMSSRFNTGSERFRSEHFIKKTVKAVQNYNYILYVPVVIVNNHGTK